MAHMGSAVDLQLKSVLVATDFSAVSEKPVRHALAIARHYGARLYVVNIVSSIGLNMAGPGSVEAAEELALSDASGFENALRTTGALDGLDCQTIIRRGDEVWKQLQNVISEKQVDLVVVGTHARRGLGKLMLGSTAEQIFRGVGCPVLTVGPDSYRDSHVDSLPDHRTFLFATDFGAASLHALSFAISFANHFQAQLAMLHVETTFPIEEGGYRWYTADDAIQMLENARIKHECRMKWELAAQKASLRLEPRLFVELGTASEKILELAARLTADSIILGLHRSRHPGATCHIPWTTAYEVVCGAKCPVLTVRNW